MENKNESGIIDNLNTPSITEVEPLFQLSNYFKPTSKNALIWGDILIAIGGLIGSSIVAAGGGLYALIGMGVSSIGIILQRFTKEEPISTMIRAVEDITLDIPIKQ